MSKRWGIFGIPCIHSLEHMRMQHGVESVHISMCGACAALSSPCEVVLSNMVAILL